ncbi:MAG: electron transfer flavoprotein subunit alpha/FixB family protein [Acidobacteriota bacterium]
MSKKVIVVLQQREGKLHRMSREAIAAGQQLAAKVDASVEAILLGSGIQELAKEVAGFGLTTVHVADHEGLGEYTPDAYVEVLEATLAAATPDFVVFPHTYQSVDYFPRLAQALDAGLLPEVTALVDGEGGELNFQRPVLGGKLVATVRVKGEGTVLLSVQSGAFSADEAQPGQAAVESLAFDAPSTSREILGVEAIGGDTIDLSKADVIVAVGRGVGGEDKLEASQQLAQILGADIGASRPVIDAGWLPRDRQIGSSGQTVAPKLYIAIGISGAIQHLVGMKGATTVVAINKDPNAPIFTVSDYGVVGDLHEILPPLVEAVREAKGE